MTDISPEEALEEARQAVELAQSAAVEASTGSALVLGRDDAVQTKRQLGAAYGLIHTTRKAALEKTTAAKEVIEAKKAELDEMRRALEMELAPLEKQMARLTDGIVAVNLYLGTDEYLEELRGGESAPADTPLTIRQAVLHMDEESVLITGFDDPENQFDHRDIASFNEWLLADPAHLEQVLPDPKGVVAITARRTPLDYTGNPIVDDARNKANLATRWLLRNGERLYYMDTEFNVGTLLIPTRRSFTALFDGLEPGTREWLAAEEAADGITRHYMKVALILQGLVDRTAIFHPLPEGGLNLIGDPDYDAGKVVLIEEEEKAITSGRQPFKEWLAERCEQLSVGQRVVGHWPAYTYHGGSRDETFTTPRNAAAPSNAGVYTIVREDHSNFFFLYDRADKIDDYDNWGYYRGQKDPTKRATYRIPKSSWREARFVPIDNVTVPEMQEYLGARTERHNYKTMFPALQAAIAFKLHEEETEAPFRALLAASLDTDDETVRELVTWFKTANKWHRALAGDLEHEKRAVQLITREFTKRGKQVPLAGLAALHAVENTIVIAARAEDLIAIVPEPRAYPEASVPQNVFVQVHSFTRTGKPREVKRWQTLTKAQVARWTILGESEAWAGWKLNPVANSYLSDPAIDEFIETIKADAVALGRGPVLAVKYVESDNGWGRWRAKGTVYLASELKDGRLTQPYVEVNPEIKGGRAVPDTADRRSRWARTHDWRMERRDRRPDDADWLPGFPDENSPLVPESPVRVNYSGANPSTIVYVSEEVMAADAVLAAQWADEQLAEKRVDEAESRIASAVWDGWKRLDEETRRQRFIDDFGDAELWEDHRKSQKPVPFPLKNNMGDKVLSAFTEAVVRESIAVAGKTVGEVLAELSAPIAGMPEALLPVRFPETTEDEGEDD